MKGLGGPYARFMLFVALVGCAPVRPVPPADTGPRLMVPVAGVAPADVEDTFHSPRGAGIHAAVDILAPHGTPVLSADDGRVLRLSRNRKGGLGIWATDESARFVYYYAHLSAYRVGIGSGSRLARGQVIGYVGSSGNAKPRAPHLHFQAMVRGGDPFDPRPYFVSGGLAR